jgi:hypothetical protein
MQSAPDLGLAAEVNHDPAAVATAIASLYRIAAIGRSYLKPTCSTERVRAGSNPGMKIDEATQLFIMIG